MNAIRVGRTSVWHPSEFMDFLQIEHVGLEVDDGVLADQAHSRNPTKKVTRLNKIAMLKGTKNLVKAKKLEHIAKISQVLQLVHQTAHRRGVSFVLDLGKDLVRLLRRRVHDR